MEQTGANGVAQISYPFLRGGGEMGELIRAYDWKRTRLGAPATWPQSLRTSVGILLHSRFPMVLLWGRELIQFYNDAYRPSLGVGGKHPSALGQRAQDCWAAEWEAIGPLLQQVLATGEGVYYEDMLTPLERNGRLEQVYWTSSYSAVPDETGGIGGVLIVCSETTEQVVNLQKLTAAQQQLETTLQHIPAGLLLFEQDGTLSFANEAARDDLRRAINGRPLPATYAETVSMMMQNAELRNTRDEPITPRDAILARAFQTGEKQELLYQRILKSSGAKTWFLSHAIPLIDENGQAMRVLVVNAEITAQHEAAEKIRESELRFRIMADATPNMIWALNPDGSNRYTNKYGLEYFGKTEESLGQTPPQELLHPDEMDRVLQTLAQAMSRLEPYSIEHRMRRHDGVYRMFLVKGAPSFYPSGELFGYVGSCIDITYMREAEQALQQSEEQFRIFSNNLQNLAWIADGDGWIFWYNQRWYDYTGTTLEEMKGWGWEKVHHPEHVERVLAFWKEAFLNSEPAEMIFPLRHKDGHYRWFLTRAVPVFDTDGKRYRWVGTNTDIHEQVLAERALRESETRFRNLAETLPQMVWVTNADGTVQEFISGKWQEYFGPVSSGEAWQNMSVPEERDAANAAFANAIASGEGFHAEIRLRNKDGQYRWHVTIGAPVKDANGAVVKWVGSVIDIHDQKTLAERLEGQVAERTIELRRSNEDLERFAHVASHDLKEPMRKIRTFADMLRTSDGDKLSERGLMSLQKILNASERMMTMVTGVLSYSKLAIGEDAIEEVDLNEIVRNVASDLEVIFQQKGATLNAGALPHVTAASVLMHQLFYNLINNAIKFSRDGVAPHIVVTGGRSDNGDVRIIVADNGIGFEPEYAESIFKTFTRLHAKDQYEGTGLGLSLCRKIVERYGGSISAEGRLGEGARFIITLP